MHPCTYVTLRRTRVQIRPAKSISNKGLQDMGVMAASGDRMRRSSLNWRGEAVGNKS